MIRASKLLWGEGLFLRPQHFQRQDAYHEWRLAETAQALSPFAWGVRRCQVDADALAHGVLRLQEIHALLPDGDFCTAPGDDELPPPVTLSGWPAGQSECTYHLSLPPLRATGGNSCDGEEAGSSAARYRMRHDPATDWFTGAVEAEVTTLHRRLRLVADTEARDHLTSLPLLRVRRTGTGSFELDPAFAPPVLSISASPLLVGLLRRTLDMLQAKVDALYGVHREPSKHVIEFRSGDIASFWLLHTCSSAYAGLSHLFHHPGLHPERLFERLLDLAGALMTFSRSHGLTDLPAYDHSAPAQAFARLDGIIRDLLETVISTRYFAIALSELRPSYFAGRLDSQKIGDSTRLYLGVQAGLPPSELVEVIPQRLKVGAPDDVEKVVLTATAGVRLTHLPQVPVAIPVRPGAYYFALEPRGPLYDRMLQARSLCIYAPSNLPDLQMELIALNGEA